MFLKPFNKSDRRIRANDIATASVTIAFFIYMTLLGLNVMFQSFTKMRMATASDVCARYLAAHKDSSPTIATDLDQIVDSYRQSSFIKDTDYDIYWSDSISTCTASNTAGCNKSLAELDGSYTYRKDFIVLITLDIPNIFNESTMTLLPSLQTSVFSVGVLEMIQ